MAGLAKRVWVAGAVGAVLLSVCASQASAAPPPASAKVSAAAHSALQEIAAESGYSSWAAFAKAREDDANRIQKEAARIVADALTYGRQVVHDYGTFKGAFEDVHVYGVTEYVIDFAGGRTLLRTSLVLEYSGFLGIGKEKQTTTNYWIPGTLESAGLATTVTKNGLETVTRVTEWVPGSIDLKVGDSRPEQKPSSSAAGLRPSTMDPKKDGSGGVASGGSSPLAGILDAMVEQAERDRQGDSDTNPDTSKPDDDGSAPDDSGSAPDDGGEPDDSGTDPGTSTDPGAENTSKSNVHWGPSETQENGNTYTAYDVTNEDGSKTTGTKTEKPDGTATCKTTNKNGGEDDAECPSGMTDEPSCGNDCERLALLVHLFGGESEPQPDVAAAAIDASAHASGSAGHVDGGAPSAPGYRNADKSGAPKDFGNSVDANAPIDWGGMFADPRTDGVVDPAEPGVGEAILEDSVELAMLNTLRDPANPPGSEELGPAPNPWNPGDAE